MTLLKIRDIKNPLLLFNTKDPKQTYLDLMVRYHPDKHLDKTEWATDISAHICGLYCRFNDMLVSQPTEELLIINKHAGYTEYVYRTRTVYELSKTPLAVKNITPWLRSPWEYTNDTMKEEFVKYLPHLEESKHGVSCSFTLSKLPSVIPLLNAWKYCGESIDAKTVAWMISRMLNLACYFFTKRIVYNGFLIKNLYVDPVKHYILPYGGWWSAHHYGKRPTLLDKEAINCLPKKALSGTSDIPTDLHLIKHTALKLLGSPMPASIPDDIPSALAEWLFAPIVHDPIASYREWYRVLRNSWGERVFTPWHVSSPYIFNI